MFMLGGFVGAIGFSHIGFLAAFPLACVLFMLTFVPVIDDISAIRRRARL